jgi:Protein of unknown function (DUF3309)
MSRNFAAPVSVFAGFTWRKEDGGADNLSDTNACPKNEPNRRTRVVPFNERNHPMLRTILLIILILALLGSVPLWPYSAGWGYGPSGGIGVVLVILIVLVVAGRL